MNVTLSKRRVELISRGLEALAQRYSKNLRYDPANDVLRDAIEEIMQLKAMVDARLKPLPELEDMEI